MVRLAPSQNFDSFFCRPDEAGAMHLIFKKNENLPENTIAAVEIFVRGATKTIDCDF